MFHYAKNTIWIICSEYVPCMQGYFTNYLNRQTLLHSYCNWYSSYLATMLPTSCINSTWVWVLALLLIQFLLMHALARMEFLALGSGLAHPQLFQAFKEWVSWWEPETEASLNKGLSSWGWAKAEAESRLPCRWQEHSYLSHHLYFLWLQQLEAKWGAGDLAFHCQMWVT